MLVMHNDSITTAKSKNKPEDNNSYTVNGYQIEVNSSSPYKTIKNIWADLEETASAPFFLSWAWISTWINTYSPELITVTAKYNDQVVAMGLFTASTEVRHKIIYSRQLRLHQIGNELMDQIWIEYNDFTCQDEHRSEAVNSCLIALQNKAFVWDEIILSMSLESRAKQIASVFKNVSIDSTQPCYSTDLTQVRTSGNSYLQSLSKNTRYQINKSTRLYQEEYGPLVIQQANSADLAKEYFREAGQYHVKRWANSGYNNAYFTKFHENLIEYAFENKGIHLHKVTAGERTVGILYCHVKGKKVYFYLQGLQSESNAKLKPGLVAHSLITQYYMDNGYESYDYMGGSSQYKMQLSKHLANITTVTIRRQRLKFYLEDFARQIKTKIKPLIIHFGSK